MQKKKVALLTVDTYRIAAAEQLKTYASIMEILHPAGQIKILCQIHGSVPESNLLYPAKAPDTPSFLCHAGNSNCIFVAEKIRQHFILYLGNIDLPDLLPQGQY